MLAISPMAMLCRTVTKPAAGVIATRPTTAPMQAPIADGLRPRTMSKNTQPSIAAAEAVLVVANASTATSLAASADPALKPNQPNHSMPVPSRTYGMLAGSCGSLAMWVWRRPRTSAPASAARPADMCTTVPPAKSSTPICRSQPCGCQVMCASGE